MGLLGSLCMCVVRGLSSATFSRVEVVSEGRRYKFEKVAAGRVEAYVKLKANEFQLYWLWRKVPVAVGGESSEADAGNSRL